MTTHKLDITNEHCPMTFVKAKIKLAQMASGDILVVTLNEGEPLINVPRSAAEEGHEIASISHVQGPIHQVTIIKK